MDDFQLEPASDLGLSHRQRTLSLQRESGLAQTCTHALYWIMMRMYLRVYHRMQVCGRQNLPPEPPYVIVANHTSHLDAMMLAAPLPWRFRDRIFPLAAGDFFFETPAVATFAMMCLNALPLWRHNCGRHALDELRTRLIEEPCIFIVFPEGSRSKDGTLQDFKAGLGMMIAQTKVPVVPCNLHGTHHALPRDCTFSRPRKLAMHIGKPLLFDSLPNRRPGWEEIAQRSRAAVLALATQRRRDAPAD